MSPHPHRRRRRRLLVAIDFDGTLLGPDGRVSPATKSAVRHVLDAGHEVVFATGRTWHESHDVLDQVDHRGHCVFAGGAHVVDAHEKIVLHRQGMEPALAREICALFERHGLPPLVLEDRDASGYDFAYSDGELPAEIRMWNERHKLLTRSVGDLQAHGHEHTMRVGTMGPHANVDAAEAELRETFAERVLSNKVDLGNVGVELLEVFDPSVNKWAGVSRVAELHGVDYADVVGIGDDMNDLHLLEGAGVAVAMGNAKPPVKALADLIIGPHAEDGLAIFLDAIADASDDAALAQVLSGELAV